MKHLKEFSINENKEAKERVTLKRKARNAGYDIGDIVYNIKLKKNITIISDEDYSRLNDESKKKWTYNDNTFEDMMNYCTLGAVGENLNYYSLVKKADSKSSKYFSFSEVEKTYNKITNIIRQDIRDFNKDEYISFQEMIKKFLDENSKVFNKKK